MLMMVTGSVAFDNDIKPLMSQIYFDISSIYKKEHNLLDFSSAIEDNTKLRYGWKFPSELA